MKTTDQICIVGHSNYFTYLTGTEWPRFPDTEQGQEDNSTDRYDFSQPPTKSKWLENCEFYSLDEHIGDQSAQTSDEEMQLD